MNDIRVKVSVGAGGIFDGDGTLSKIVGVDAESGCGLIQVIVQWALWHELEIADIDLQPASDGDAGGDAVTIHFE